MRFFILSLLAYTVGAQFFCADHVQRCAVSVEHFEKEIMDLKNEAFRQCFHRPVCHDERTSYNRCFRESLRAVRAPFNGDLQTFDRFAETANRYRASLDNCFMNSPVPPRRNDFGPRFIDEDAVYARAIYSTEITDRLWGLPESSHPQLNTMGVCLVKEFALRVFGSGIGRMFSSVDPRLNNISSACNIEEYEVACYRNILETNTHYNQLLYSRDYALKQCIQNVRVNTPCKQVDGGRLRSCICSVREEFERQIQAEMLHCVRRQSLLPSAMPPFVGQHNPFTSRTVNRGGYERGAAAAIPIPVPPLDGIEHVSVVQGEIVNGQCLCACGGGDTRSVLSKMGVYLRGGNEQSRFYQHPSEFLKQEYWQGYPKKDDVPIQMDQKDEKSTHLPKEETISKSRLPAQ